MAVFMSETFRPMRHRNYQLYWFGFLVSNAGAWIQSVAQGWLVYEISGSAAWLGAIGFVRAFPMIFLSLFGGAVADRFPKKRILYITQTVQLLSAVILGVLTSLHIVQVWHVIALSTLSAVAQAFDNPARQALVPSLVEREDLHAAISLNAIAFNGAAVFGPSLTGVLVPAVGLAGCFYINAASFVSVFLALALMKFPPHKPRTREQSMVRDVMEGLRFVGTNPVIMAMISMAAVTSFLARPYQQFIVVFAKDVLSGQIGLAGILQAAPAMGTVIFMLAVASLGNIQYKGKLLVGSGLGFCAAMIAFSWSRNIYLSIVLLVVTGGMNMTWQTSLNTLLQTNVPDMMRGRVMASYTITAIGMMPLGQGPMGYTMEHLGPQWSLTLGAALSGLWVAYMALIRVRNVTKLP
ncbi:MAG TPA: MFS transporter [Symbiobacteriaceae bacterium]|nr:MFS transporter [Symbiobacteriaceae bacterium]